VGQLIGGINVQINSNTVLFVQVSERVFEFNSGNVKNVQEQAAIGGIRLFLESQPAGKGK
jgi:hypothetical protein